MKLAWQVPRQTYSYFVDHLLSNGSTSVRLDILARYIKFVRGLRASPSMEVAVLCGVVSGDMQTTTGSNLNLIRLETQLNIMAVSMNMVRDELGKRMAAAIPESDVWRVGFLAKLLQERGEAHYGGLQTNELTSLIDSLCMN